PQLLRGEAAEPREDDEDRRISVGPEVGGPREEALRAEDLAQVVIAPRVVDHRGVSRDEAEARDRGGGQRDSDVRATLGRRGRGQGFLQRLPSRSRNLSADSGPTVPAA